MHTKIKQFLFFKSMQCFKTKNFDDDYILIKTIIALEIESNIKQAIISLNLKYMYTLNIHTYTIYKIKLSPKVN